MIKRPDFIVIGAMKCATTTLHEQLARQPGVFMSHQKEPNFFSDDDCYHRGLAWYSSLFEPAGDGDLCGESSTHYAKLPTYPRAVARMARDLPHVKLIYVMRHPIDRLVSHYIHEVTTGRIRLSLSDAVERYSELIEYGRYAMQLQPYRDAFGPSRILPVYFGRLVRHSQLELDRIGRFLGLSHPLLWDASMKPQNTSRDRLRASAIREALVRAPVLTSVRRRIIPAGVSQSIKGLWRVRMDRPQITPELRERLREVFDADLAQLGDWLGIDLNCHNFDDATCACAREWAD